MITNKEENNTNMEFTNILSAAISKPMVGIGSGAISGLAWVLHWLGVITVFASTIGAVLGAIIAAIHLYLLFKNKFWITKEKE